jgi:4-hydroxy-4-methyl-2-oxoglutarate aldolase
VIPADRPDDGVVVHPSPPSAPDEAIAVLERVGLATVSSALPPVTLRARVLDGHALHRIGGRGAVAGTVVTAWNVWGRTPINAQLFEMLRPGDVLVVAGDTSRALWGDLATSRAMQRGARAAIVDGCARDVDAVAATGFSVWAARIYVGEGARAGGPGAINVPVTVRGAIVEPGDVVVADGDGIGFVPRAMLDDVVAAAEARDREDRQVLDDLSGRGS